MKKIFWIVVVISYCFTIFFITHSPVSTGEHTMSLLNHWFSFEEELLSTINLVMRKITHFITFGILAIISLQLFTNKNKYFYAWLVATIYGAIDEWHQTFIDGRMGLWTDALLNSVGAGVFLVVAYVLGNNKNE